MATMGPIYGARSVGQQAVNPANGNGSSKVPTRNDFDVPVLSNVAGFWGISVPMLIALFAVTWFLIERYD